jgi:hypothetical protein
MQVRELNMQMENPDSASGNVPDLTGTILN